MDASFKRLLLLFAVAITAVFIIRYTPVVLYGNGHFAEDFAVYWRALSALDHWPPLSPYHAGVDAQYFEGKISASYHPYLNPPFFILSFWPLQFLPYWGAVAVWYGLQIGFWLFVMNRRETRALWPHWAADKRYLLNSAVLALPFVAHTILCGQIGLLLAALFLLGLGLLKEKPPAAGAVFALLAIKPQLLPVVGVLLLFGKHGAALLSYLAGLAALVLLSTGIWGFSVWEDYNRALMLHMQMMSLPNIPAAFSMQLISVYNGLKLAGVEPGAAMLLQMAAAAMAVLVLAWRAWRQPLAPSTFALALASAFLTSFYVLQYDAVIWMAVLLLLLEKPLNLAGRLIVILTLSSGVTVPLLQAMHLPAGMATALLLWGLCLHTALERRLIAA